MGLSTSGSVAPSVGPVRYTGSAPDEVIELLLTEAALDKLGARNISAEETGNCCETRMCSSATRTSLRWDAGGCSSAARMAGAACPW